MRRSRGIGGHRAALGTLAFVGGVVLGAVTWGQAVRRCRRDLFSPSAFKRFAALGYLAGHRDADTARVLGEYVAWERHPLLRRRARRLLDRMAPYLEQE